ncbi:MAG: urease accessory protein UreD, partial [Cyanobium sp.]
AAQKVYGTVGRSRRVPGGHWAHQDLVVTVAEGADLEWLPQELVLFGEGLYSQSQRVELAPGASWLGAEVVRLGRTAAGETLGRGRWRSSLEVVRTRPQGRRWELVDRLELADGALEGEHGMAAQPVFGSLVWAAPGPIPDLAMDVLLQEARRARVGLEGEMACGALDQGLVARYRGMSTTAARTWFTRLWAAVRSQRGLPPPELPRCWPFQEQPLLPEPPAPEHREDGRVAL